MMLTTKRPSRFLLAFLGINRYLCEGAALNPDLSPIIPNQELMEEQFDASAKSHRQNFCEEQTNFTDLDMDLNTALKGKRINIAVGYDPNFVNLDSDGFINPKDPGLMIVLLDEMARRGEFSWRESFVIEQSPIEGKSWEDLLLWSIDTYDISANWWFFTHERSAKGVSFPRGWYDASLCIIAKKDEDTSSSFNAFNWGRPFTPAVWISLTVTMLLSGIICFYLEETRLRKKAVKKYTSVLTSYIHASFIVFTGHLDLLPTTHSGQLVSFSLSFFALLMLSSYTANLCSFLVVQQSAFKVNIESVSDVVRLGKSFCVYGSNSAAQVALESTYTDVIVVEKFSDLDTVLGLQKNECDYALIGMSGWLEYERTEETNGECNLDRVGRTFKNFEAGFATKSDSGTLCTSLVRDVINSILYEMHEDDFVKQAWDDHLARKQDIITPCSDLNAPIPLTESIGTLNMTHLGGIFLFHFVLVAIAITGAFRPKCSSSNNEKNTNDDSATAIAPLYAPAQGGKSHLGRASRGLGVRPNCVDLEDFNPNPNIQGPQIHFTKSIRRHDVTPVTDSSTNISLSGTESESSNIIPQSHFLGEKETIISNEMKEEVFEEDRNLRVEEQLRQMELKLSEVEGQFVQISSLFRDINMTYSGSLRRDDSDSVVIEEAI